MNKINLILIVMALVLFTLIVCLIVLLSQNIKHQKKLLVEDEQSFEMNKSIVEIKEQDEETSAKITDTQIKTNTFDDKLLLDKEDERYPLYLKIKEQAYKETKILFDLRLFKADGNYLDIDLLMINSNGIFLFETINQAGYAFGSLNDAYWELAEASDRTGLKHSFRNPIAINAKRAKYINELLNVDYCNIYSIVVFSDDIQIMDKYDDSSTYVINYRDLDLVFKTIDNLNQDGNKLDEVIVDIIYNKLLNSSNLNQ